MGEVYRDRDAALKRDVALKVLPASFAGDPERMARFQREAEVLASLEPWCVTIPIGRSSRRRRPHGFAACSNDAW